MSLTKTMTKAKLPFSGCYGTLYDLAEYEVDPDSGYSAEYMDNYWCKDFNFRYWFDCLAKEYVKQFNHELKELLEVEEELISFESTFSPKEYNFDTDRIFVNVSDRFYQRLIEHTLSHPADLRTVVVREFTSRPGFIPYYSDNPVDWLEKIRTNQPLKEVEVYILIEVLILENKDDILNNIYDEISTNTELLEVGSPLYTDSYQLGN